MCIKCFNRFPTYNINMWKCDSTTTLLEYNSTLLQKWPTNYMTLIFSIQFWLITKAIVQFLKMVSHTTLTILHWNYRISNRFLDNTPQCKETYLEVRGYRHSFYTFHDKRGYMYFIEISCHKSRKYTRDACVYSDNKYEVPIKHRRMISDRWDNLFALQYRQFVWSWWLLTPDELILILTFSKKIA